MGKQIAFFLDDDVVERKEDTGKTWKELCELGIQVALAQKFGKADPEHASGEAVGE
jgi:hypothetical protein